MNAKKIMGAVLVALLAAALFVGAGAAAPEDADGTTVFFYEPLTQADYTGTWTNAAGDSISLVPGKQGSSDVHYFNGANGVEGVYKQGDYSITVKFPTASVVGLATTGGSTPVIYDVIGKTFYNDGASTLEITVVSASSKITTNASLITNPYDITTDGTNGAVTVADLIAGKYEIRAIFDATKFVDGTPDELLKAKDAYSFTVKNSADPEITAVADSVVVGDTLKVTIAGVPGTEYKLTVDGFTIPTQAGITGGSDVATKITFTMPNNGEKTVTLLAVKDGEGSAVVGNDDASVDIEILEGEITAEANKDAYFIGQKIVLSGTSTGSKVLYFYVEGTNVKTAQIVTSSGAAFSATVEADKTWEAEITYDLLKKAVANQGLDKLDAGTYTIYVSAEDISTAEPDWTFGYDVKNLKPYTTVSANLKQLFLTAELQTSVVAQGSDLVVTGTAEATSEVMYYIFGNNFYVNGTQSVKKDSTFKIEETIYASSMAAGQYFVVIQHPMYDKMFNLGPSMLEPATIILNTTGEVTETKATVENTLFKANSRQTANAAEALCQALDTQNIDDIYVKATFIVAAPTATMNPVPSEVAKGTKLTISGTTNMAPGELITVEMLSTAFAAVPKEDVNAASFIALTTKVQDDGTWEVTFDTTGLNIDEYTITATAGQFVSTAKVNVVEKAPVTPEQPDTPVTPEQPEQPEQPTGPETPGFGALAALAGLGAVAVLLLRRE